MASKADLIAALRADMDAIASGGSRDGCDLADEDPRRSSDSQRHAEGLGREKDAEGASDAEGACELTAEQAFQKILRLAAAREQSSVRLRARLARDGYGPETIEEALARAVRAHAVDDRRYAEALVRMRVASGKGVEGILAEIEELGIDPEGLEAVAEYRVGGEDVDVERALALLARRPPRAKNQRDAAFRKLVQQGFGSATAATAARRWAESQGAR